MVRKYIKKNNKVKKYSSDTLKLALGEINNGLISVRGASKKYDVPFSTLLHAKKGTRAVGVEAGRPTAIPPIEEDKLANGLPKFGTLEKWGWGLSRKEVFDIIAEFVISNNIKTPFKNGYPGEDWFLGFKKRNRLSIKKPQSLEFARKKATDPFIIYDCLDLLQKTIHDLGLEDKPSRIYNLDETSFCLDPSKTKVVGEKNKPSARVVSGPGRENTTVLFAANASGEKLPPLIVFQGKNLWDTWLAPEDKAYPNTTYTATPNGWMQTDVFYNYFERNFLVNCVPERPILLIFDGHSTHLSSKTVELAIANNVTILKLPAHSSHLLQPLDISVYKSLKVRWDEKLTAFQRQHIGVKIPKKEFSILVGTVWRETSPNIIMQGFKSTGIFPFNKEAVDKSKFDPEALKHYENRIMHGDNPDVSSPNILPETRDNQPRPGPSGLHTPRRDIVTEHPQQINQLTPQNRSFEDILLDTIRQTPILKKTTKRRVVPGAEVVTEPESRKILEQKEKEAKNKKLLKKIKLKNNGKAKKAKLALRKKSVIKTTKKSKTKKVYEDSDESEEVEISDSEDDFEKLTMNDLVTCLSEEELEEEFDEHLDGTRYKAGDFVLVSLPSKTSVKHYVGQILHFNEHEPVVKFARKRSGPGSVFVWPEQEDISETTVEDILVRLPLPIVGRREELIFKVSFASYNIQ